MDSDNLGVAESEIPLPRIGLFLLTSVFSQLLTVARFYCGDVEFQQLEVVHFRESTQRPIPSVHAMGFKLRRSWTR